MIKENNLLYEKIPKSEKTLLEAIHDLDELSYKSFDLLALSRKAISIFQDVFSNINYRPVLLIDGDETILLKGDGEKISSAEYSDIQNSTSVSITMFNEKTLTDFEIGKITYPETDSLTLHEKHSVEFVFAVMVTRLSKLLESSFQKLTIQSEKIELEEKNQLLKTLHEFMMQIVTLEQKFDLHQSFKDAIEIHFYIEPMVIFEFSGINEDGTLTFYNAFDETEEISIKREHLPETGSVVEADLSTIDNFMGLNHVFVNFVHQKISHIFGFGPCMLSETGDLSQIKIETLQLMIEIFSLSFETMQKKDELFKLAVIDGLTGMFNRRYFDSSLQIEIEKCLRYESSMFSLIIFDIDHFKSFNDTYGHQTGDDVLQMVSSHVKKIVRKTDILCRYGGEEFAIIATGSDENAGHTVAEKARKAVESIIIPTFKGNTSVTISLGVAEWNKSLSGEQLIEQADKALYASKENGRNQTTLFKSLKDQKD